MVTVCRSTVIDAPIDAVWHVLRDFNGHDRWHPAVEVSRLEDGAETDQVGCVRNFRLRDGGALREQLLSLSDRDRSLSYCILEAPLPLVGYVASLRLRPITDGGRTFCEWRSSFAAPPGREAELARLVGEEIYEAGFAALRRHLDGPGGGRHRVPHPTFAVPAGETLSGGAVVAEAYGGPEVLRWRALPVPPPGPGQVRLRHTAIGLNYIDVYCRTGYFRMYEPPATPGMEAAGVVLDVGEGVAGLLPGDRVGYACAPPGAYAELRTMDAGLLVPLPDAVDDAATAGGLLKGMTAAFLLHQVRPVRPEEVVLVHAAAGGVGLLLCQWARLARANGCAYPLVGAGAGFVDAVMAITEGRGADVIFDAVGRDTVPHAYAALAARGHLVSYGQASGDIAPLDIAAYAGKSATVSRPNYGQYTDTPAKVRALADQLFAALARGILRVEIGQRFPLRQAEAAHRALESRQTVGSTLLLP